MKLKDLYISLIFVSVVIWIFSIRSCRKEREMSDYFQNHKDSTWFYKDKAGQSHARAEHLFLEKRALQLEIKALSEELDIAKRKITGIKRISVRGADTFHIRDSVYIDKWNTIKIISKDSIFVSIKDEYQIVDYWNRKWFLGKKKYYVDVKNSNPLLKIEKITSREIKIKQPTIIIGPSIQYNPINQWVTPGVSIMYYPLTIKF